MLNSVASGDHALPQSPAFLVVGGIAAERDDVWRPRRRRNPLAFREEERLRQDTAADFDRPDRAGFGPIARNSAAHLASALRAVPCPKSFPGELQRQHVSSIKDRGRVARPFGFALT